MRTAVVRVNVDPDGRLDPQLVADGLGQLRRAGFEIIAAPAASMPPRGREVEFILMGDDPATLTAQAVAAAMDVFGGSPTAGPVTFISRGTDEDALGVVAAFGVSAVVTRVNEDGEEVAVFTFRPDELAKVPESRLRTALEAALNCEIRLVVA